MAGVDNLTPWKAGQSGNPRGGSKKLRDRKYLREFLRDEMAQQADPDVIKDIIGSRVVDLDDVSADDAIAYMRSMLEAGLTQGQVIAKRIVSDAMGTGREAAIARTQIISTEPKTFEIEPLEDPKSPNFVPTEAEQVQLERDAVDGEVVH